MKPHPKPKRLFHGTTEAHLPAILKDGIVPRDPGSMGNWEHTICSNEGCVYLTDAYALYFAFCATPIESFNKDASGARAVVLSLNVRALDERSFLPDEDFLGQALPRGEDPRFKGRNVLEVTKEIDGRDYRHAWLASLRFLGTVAHEGPIPAHAITRIAFIKPEPQLILAGHDPTITLDHYRILGERYRAFCRWAFTGEAPPPMVPYEVRAQMDDDLAVAHPQFANQRGRTKDEDREFWLELWRKNVEVVSRREYAA